MPTVEDYFDDDTDLPLPSSSSSGPRSALSGSGLKGALLEEITSDDEGDFDLSKLAEQNRGIFGENATGPAPPAFVPDRGESSKGKMAVRDEGEMSPDATPRMNPNSLMGGFMGDMMKMQQAEDDRLERMRQQFGNTRVAGDPGEYKL